MFDQDAPCRARRLVPETKLLDERPVGREIGVPEVGQQPPPGPDHFEQPSTPVMILCMGAEVIGEGVDPLGEKRHLDPGRAGVLVVKPVFGQNGLFIVRHARVSLFYIRLCEYANSR